MDARNGRLLLAAEGLWHGDGWQRRMRRLASRRRFNGELPQVKGERVSDVIRSSGQGAAINSAHDRFN